MDKLIQKYLTEIEKLLKENLYFDYENNYLDLETLNQIERILRRLYVDACLTNNYDINMLRNNSSD
jgi:hypothetical protein